MSNGTIFLSVIQEQVEWNKPSGIIFSGKTLKKDIEKECKTCKTCRLTKKRTVKSDKLPAKEAETIPWETLCVDLIGPYNIKSNKHKDKELILQAVTMIDQ